MSYAHDIATEVIQAIAEMDDRTSPEDQPDMMLVTALELRDLITVAIQNAAPESQPAAWRHSKTHSLHDEQSDVRLADGDEWAEPLYLAPSRKVGDLAGWVCTDMDGSAAIGFTQEQAQRGASPACDEFLPVYFAAPTSA